MTIPVQELRRGLLEARLVRRNARYSKTNIDAIVERAWATSRVARLRRSGVYREVWVGSPCLIAEQARTYLCQMLPTIPAVVLEDAVRRTYSDRGICHRFTVLREGLVQAWLHLLAERRLK